jgi:hypothetical protein
LFFLLLSYWQASQSGLSIEQANASAKSVCFAACGTMMEMLQRAR